MPVQFVFRAKGHPNISGVHPSTMEFTQHRHLTPAGDCIIGVSADFDPAALQRFLEGAKGLIFTLRCGSSSETIRADHNPSFKAREEIVIRRGPFTSERTIATGADRACIDLDRHFIEMIKNPDAAIEVEIEKSYQ